jgi:PAS domain-containing protein
MSGSPATRGGAPDRQVSLASGGRHEGVAANTREAVVATESVREGGGAGDPPTPLTSSAMTRARRSPVTTTDRTARHQRPRTEESVTASAWERFVTGEDVTDGVRPEILMSWYRCRDEYEVDPWRERAAAAPDEEQAHSLEDDVVVAQLGGVAKSVEPDVSALDGLVAVTDSVGRILVAWGDRQTLHRAEEQHLGPRYTWSEQMAGTNGMGTALENHEPTLVTGREHWCAGFHDWTCAGIAIRDPLTDRPLGALNISSYKGPLAGNVLPWMKEAVRGIEAELQVSALRAFTQLTVVFREHAARAHGPLAIADNAGRFLLANQEAQDLLGISASAPADHARLGQAEPPRSAELKDLLLQAVQGARRDRSWGGFAQVQLHGMQAELEVAFQAVLSEERVIGILVGVRDDLRCAESERLVSRPRLRRGPTPRLIGLRGNRLLLVAPREVRFAEASGSTVWLETDQGRLRVPQRGIGNFEERVEGQGFLRVHRRYLVNLGRVREIAVRAKGSYWLFLEGAERAPIPVSRRCAAEFRTLLGL